MSSSSIASTAVLDHLHNWQQRAGLALTWPTFTSDAYSDQWVAIKIVLEQASTRSCELTAAVPEVQDHGRV